MSDYRKSEKQRVSKMPERFQHIHDIVGNAGPTNYSVHFPWTHPMNKVPNCFAMLGDGSIIFKLEVVDEDTFKLAVLPPPWRGPEDYDFLFLNHGIKEGDTINYETLLKIVEESVLHIRRRSPVLYPEVV